MKVLNFFVALCFLFLFANIIDAVAGKRSILQQLGYSTLLTSPLNAITHLGTPLWLRRELWKSPILKPTSKIFPNLYTLRENFAMIKQEAAFAMQKSKPIMNDLYFNGIADKGWKRFYIKWYGPPDPLAEKICPKTCALLQTMPEVHLGMFSILMPGSKIPPHFGPARMCLRYHLGIQTPNDANCNIRVGNDTYFWKDGEDVIFDDTVTHQVQNNTDKPRIILFLDIERPQEGLFKLATKKMIDTLGPMTTRGNEKNEKVVNN
jgi:beta-hydroxylase